jgi:hypothetical protein
MRGAVRAMVARSAAARTWVRFAAVVLALSPGCKAEISNGEPLAINAPAGIGELGLSLALPPMQRIEIASVAFTITNFGSVVENGNFPVQTGASFKALVALPQGGGYNIALEATTTKAVRCMGSEEFGIVAGRRTVLGVVVRCVSEPRATGTLQIDGTFNLCPSVDLIVADATDADVGGSVELTGRASDVDSRPSALEYAWSTTAGQLTDPTAAGSAFVCTKPGDADITLTVNDGDPGCPPVTASVTVTCHAGAMAAGAGGSGGGSGSTAGAGGGSGSTAGTAGTAGSSGTAGESGTGVDDDDAGVPM